MNQPSVILERGVEAYALTYAAMQAFTNARTANTPDQFWMVEHPPVYTLGLGADPAHVLDAGSYEVIQTDRGGEVTYHGPGQAIVYLLIDLRRNSSKKKLFAREFVQTIEQAVITTLRAYNLMGCRHAGAPGIYLTEGNLAGAKIAALGLKIRGNGCTYHGVSLNVDMDLEPFSRINPCGDASLLCTDMRTAGAMCNTAEVRQRLTANLQQLVLTHAYSLDAS